MCLWVTFHQLSFKRAKVSRYISNHSFPPKCHPIKIEIKPRLLTVDRCFLPWDKTVGGSFSRTARHGLFRLGCQSPAPETAPSTRSIKDKQINYYYYHHWVQLGGAVKVKNKFFFVHKVLCQGNSWQMRVYCTTGQIRTQHFKCTRHNSHVLIQGDTDLCWRICLTTKKSATKS